MRASIMLILVKIIVLLSIISTRLTSCSESMSSDDIIHHTFSQVSGDDWNLTISCGNKDYSRNNNSIEHKNISSQNRIHFEEVYRLSCYVDSIVTQITSLCLRGTAQDTFDLTLRSKKHFPQQTYEVFNKLLTEKLIEDQMECHRRKVGTKRKKFQSDRKFLRSTQLSPNWDIDTGHLKTFGTANICAYFNNGKYFENGQQTDRVSSGREENYLRITCSSTSELMHETDKTNKNVDNNSKISEKKVCFQTCQQKGFVVNTILKKRTKRKVVPCNHKLSSQNQTLTTPQPCRAIYKKDHKRRKRNSGLSPELMYSFIEQAVQPGGHISLKCSASGDSLPKFTWKLDNDIHVTSTHRYSIGQFIDHSGFVVSHLNISGVRVDDGGLYECVATNNKGTVSHSARLNVYGPPYIRPMTAVHGISGSNVKILCPYYGYPISSVKWESSALDISLDPRYIQNDGILEINNPDPYKDIGSLICSVTSPGGELAKREVQFQISSPPVLSPISYPPTLRAGERAQISCTVISGDMPIYFTWMKDGAPISASMQIDVRNAEFFSLLIVKSLSAMHSGTYTCISTNPAGKVNVSTELIVKVPPFWNAEPQDISVLLGSPLKLICDANGYPEPKKSWFKQRAKDSKAFDPMSILNGHRITFPNGTFLIDSTAKQDEGIYRCSAENGIGAALYKNVLVKINEPARFDVPSHNVTVKRKDSVTLICDILGDNPIKNVWLFNSREINSNHRLKINDIRKDNGLRSELIVSRTDRQDSGLYRCQASNSYGRSEHFIHLSVLEKPDPPRQLELIQADSRSVKLRWKRPFSGNSPLIGYQLQYESVTSDSRATWSSATTINITADSNNLPKDMDNMMDDSLDYEQGSVGSLQPDTMYSMRMLAVNQIDTSVYSEVITVKTHEEAPSEPPQNVKVQAGESGELIVSWQPPRVSSWHGTLLGYTLHWTEVENSNHKPRTNSHFIQGSTNSKFSITGLGQFTKYRITITATNRAGNGPQSIPVLASTKEGVPSSPPQSVKCTPLSSQSLKIEWTPPPLHHHGGNLLGYKILYKPLIDIYTEETATSAEVKRTSSSETYLHALLKYTNYSIQVLAYTGAGDGIHSPAVYCTTDQDIPGPPANIKANTLNPDTILVSWMPPRQPNGIILYYTLYYREVGSESPIARQISLQEAEKRTGPGLAGTFEVRQLKEKKKYEFWLSASTTAGEGSATLPVVETLMTKAGAKIASFGSVVRSESGRPLLLGCTAAGNPSPRVTWMYSKKVISHGHQYRVTPLGNLVIHSVDQSVSGNYTCTADNLYGSDEITYSVICLLPPSPPSLQLLYTTPSSAQLQWTVPHDGGSPILGYTLSFKRTEESVQVMELSPDITSFKLDGLKCGSKYLFQIASYNRVGKGEFSKQLQAVTKGEAPSFPKDWSHLVSSNSSCININMQRALNANDAMICPLLSLTIEYRKDEGGSSTASWNMINFQHNREPLIIGPLPSAQWFQIKLTAENHAGKAEAKLRAATTTLTGELLSTGSYTPVPVNPVDFDMSQDGIFNVISITLATLAGLSTVCVVYLLVAKRSVLCSHNTQPEYIDRKRSQSQASDEKTMYTAEQQNLRNYQHDYGTSPGHMRREKNTNDDMYEISPYATFQVAGAQRQSPAISLDHTLQFRTFGIVDNDASPSPCKKHHSQKTHRYTKSKGEDSIENGCELLQPLRMRGRSRQGSGPSYCVPLAHQGEGFQAVVHSNKNDAF